MRKNKEFDQSTAVICLYHCAASEPSSVSGSLINKPVNELLRDSKYFKTACKQTIARFDVVNCLVSTKISNLIDSCEIELKAFHQCALELLSDH